MGGPSILKANHPPLKMELMKGGSFDLDPTRNKFGNDMVLVMTQRESFGRLGIKNGFGPIGNDSPH